MIKSYWKQDVKKALDQAFGEWMSTKCLVAFSQKEPADVTDEFMQFIEVFWAELERLTPSPDPELTLDALQQEAAGNKLARFATFLDAIRISKDAVARGPGAKTDIAGYLGYSALTVTKLAKMFGLPSDCINLDAKPDMYWTALHHSPTPVETIRHAVAQGWTTGTQVKKYLGIETRKTELPLLVTEVNLQITPGRAVILDDRIQPEDNWPTVEVRIMKAKKKEK